MWYFWGIPLAPANHAWFTAVFFFTCLAFTVMLMRVYSRVFLVGRMDLTDYIMILAMGWSIAWLVSVIEQVRLGLGVGINFQDLEQFLFWLFFTIQFYMLGQYTIKLSILTQYYVIFTTSTARKIMRWMFVWFAVYGVVNCITPIFMCNPPSKFWNTTGPGYCTNYNNMHYALSTLNVITDFMVLTFPIPFLIKLKLPMRIRIILVITFGCGLFASIVSMMRFQALVINASGGPDQEPILGVQIIIWSGLEMNMAIVCGSVPAVKPLFTLIFPALNKMGTTPAASAQPYNKQPSSKSWVSMGRFQNRNGTNQGPYHDLEATEVGKIEVEQSIEMKSVVLAESSSERNLISDYSKPFRGTGGQSVVIHSDQI